MGRRIAATVGSLVLALVGVVLVGVSPAQALIYLPSFAVSPNPIVLGQPFTVQAGWGDVYDSTVPLGCPNPIDWVINDPNGNPVAAGHIDGEIFDPNGGPPQTFTGQGVIGLDHPAGRYTISRASDSERCASGGGYDLDYAYNIDVVYPDGYTPPPSFALSPAAQSHSVDDVATLTATVKDQATGAAEPGITIGFSITGPNSGVTGSCQPSNCATDDTGTVTWTYQGSSVGDDTVNVHLAGQTGPGTKQQVAVTWTHSVNGYAYAALGDSYSSGEGAYAYVDGTNQPYVNMCHRSALAYGPRLAAAYPTALGDMAHVACSGAITDDLFLPNHAGNEAPDGSTEPAQLCTADAAIGACGTARIPALGPHTKTVSLTVGGNDVGFASVIQSCVWLSVGPGRVAQPGHPDCSLRRDVTTPITQRLAALSGLGNASIDGRPVHSYASILAAIHRAAPNAHVYIAGYPRLFQDNNLRTCQVGTAVINGDYGFNIDVTALDAAYLDTMATLLNRAISNATQRAGTWATYVDVTGRFTGHGLCSTDPWINPINGSATVSPPGVIPGSIPTEDAHPSVTGQSRGYQAAFAAAGGGS